MKSHFNFKNPTYGSRQHYYQVYQDYLMPIRLRINWNLVSRIRLFQTVFFTKSAVEWVIWLHLVVVIPKLLI